MPKLTADQIGKNLELLPGWKYENNAISKQYKFKEFLDGIRFIDKVADIAEAADHHPDIHVNYTRVTFVCSTHSEGGVTSKDFDLAGKIERLFGS